MTSEVLPMSESIYEVERAFIELREATKNSHWQTEVVRLAEQSIRERFDELEQAAARLSVERAEFRRENDTLRAQLSEAQARLADAESRIEQAQKQEPAAWAYRFDLQKRHDDVHDNDAYFEVVYRTHRELSPDDPFGKRGKDFDDAAETTETPLYAAPVAQAAAHGVGALPFIIRGDNPPVIDWSAKGGRGCRVATDEEAAMWRILSAPAAPAAQAAQTVAVPDA
jgi:hypothetical protein